MREGVIQDTFYRYKAAVEEGGIDALLKANRRKPNLKNQVDETVEQTVLEYAIGFPTYSQYRVSNELRKQGIFVSDSGVRSIWLCQGLENFKQCLKALGAKVAKASIILTEVQIAVFEKKKDDDIACNEIETQPPGYFGS